MSYKIILECDCAPLTPRPNEYVDKTFKNISALFGNWIFEKIVENEEEAIAEKQKYEKIFTNLYKNGNIRYASWDYIEIKE